MSAGDDLDKPVLKLICWKDAALQVEYQEPITEKHLDVFRGLKEKCEAKKLAPCHDRCPVRSFCERS